MIHNLLRPDLARRNAFAVFDEKIRWAKDRANQARTLSQQLALLDELFSVTPRVLLYTMVPCFGPAMGMLALLGRMTNGVPGAGDLDLEVTRGLPYNVTTQMDLDLWAVAQAIRAHDLSRQVFLEQDGAGLVRLYQAGELPGVAQAAVAGFLNQYGARGVAEIDAGRSRWEDNPKELLQTVKQFLDLDADHGPDAIFAANAARGEAAASRLAELVSQRPGGWLKKHVAHFAAHRVRALAGLRELPKFYAVRMIGLMRKLLLLSGSQLAASGLLSQSEDIFFLRMEELHHLAAQQQEDGSWTISAQPPEATWRAG